MTGSPSPAPTEDEVLRAGGDAHENQAIDVTRFKGVRGCAKCGKDHNVTVYKHIGPQIHRTDVTINNHRAERANLVGYAVCPNTYQLIGFWDADWKELE